MVDPPNFQPLKGILRTKTEEDAAEISSSASASIPDDHYMASAISDSGMGWRSAANGHEWYVATVAVADGGLSGAQSDGAGPYELPSTDAGWAITIGVGLMELLDRIFSWRVECSCGWTGGRLGVFTQSEAVGRE